MEKAIIKIKYKNQKAVELVVYYTNQEQLNSIINTLHQDQVNINYYKVDEIE